MQSKSKNHIRSMTTISIFLALLCACSFIVLPLPFTPVVLSLHTVLVNIISLILKPKHAFLCMMLYLVMGLVGLPVFSGGVGGADKLLGPTGGFYFGFLISALVMSLLKGSKPCFVHYFAVTLFAGLTVQHLFAVLFMCFHNGFNIYASFISVSLPFIAGDILKCALSSLLALRMFKIINS